MPARPDLPASGASPLLPRCRAACLQIQRRDWRCASCGSERDVAAIEERLCAMLQQVGGERGTLG